MWKCEGVMACSKPSCLSDFLAETISSMAAKAGTAERASSTISTATGFSVWQYALPGVLDGWNRTRGRLPKSSNIR